MNAHLSPLIFCTQKVFTTRGVEGISRMLIIVLSRKFSIHSNRSSSLSIFFVDNLEHGSFLWNSLGKYWDFPHFPHNPQVGN